MIASQADLWGEAALRQPGGPTYEFFAGLLPPLRDVDADFLHYPIVLSAPGSPAKARLVSNGGALNALARQPNWKNETGIPVHVRVGRDREPFGADLARLDGPGYADGFLPIVQLRYTHGGAGYGQEAFAAVDEPLAAAGTAVVRFDFPAPDRGQIDLRFEYGSELLTARGGTIRDPAGKVLAVYDGNWDWNPARNLLISKAEHAAVGVRLPLHPADRRRFRPGRGDRFLPPAARPVRAPLARPAGRRHERRGPRACTSTTPGVR